MSIKIEGGTTKIAEGSYRYDYEDTAGYHIVVFTANRTPKIGDTIVNGELADAVLPQSNQDKSRWLPSDEGEWPEYQ